MEGPSRIATKKTLLFRCTVALGLFLSLATPILWPSSVIAQQSSQLTTPRNFMTLTSSTPNIPSTLQERTLRVDTFPRNHAAERRMKQTGTTVAARLEEWPSPRIAPPRQPAPAHNSRMSHALPEFVAEDTAFSTQMRMPIAALWAGRLQVDGFYLEVSANSMFGGLGQSSDLWWAAPASLRLRSATSYGVKLSFRLPHIHTRTLCRYFVGGRR